MVSNGTDTVGLPQWLTKEYFEKVLQKSRKEETIRILELEIRPVTPKGENYASIMTRARITFEFGKATKAKEQVSCIVKIPLDIDPILREIYKPYQVSKTEMDMYEKVLPELSALLWKIGDKDKLFADTIYVDCTTEAIIFEDLSVLDFVTADRIKGMNMTHAKLALRKLAKMHAAAAVLNERNQGSLEQFTRGIFNRHTRGFSIFFENLLAICADFAGDCADLGPYYKEKLLKLIPHAVEYATRTFDKKEGQFHTLCHGDFWINNVMLRYGDSVKENLDNVNHSQCPKVANDIMLIDFQFCRWTSPAIDLHYFFNTSLESNLRLNGQEELVQFYHKVLSDTLQALGYKGHVPTLHEFWLEMEDRRFYAVLSALVIQTFMINENTQDADVQALLLDDERGRNFRKMLYRNPVVQKNAKDLLPIFDRRGLLDIIE